VVVVVVVEGGGTTGTVEQPGPDVPAPWSDGTAPVVPSCSIPITEVAARAVEPTAASTATPDAGAMASSTDPVEVTRWTEVTELPTSTATHAAGAPSASPNDPLPRISTSDAVSAPCVGAARVVDETAWSVENSTVSCWHPLPVDGGVVVTVPELADPPPADSPVEVPADAPVAAPRVEVACSTGCAHVAPVGHGTGVGTGAGLGSVPVGGHDIIDEQDPSVLDR